MPTDSNIYDLREIQRRTEGEGSRKPEERAVAAAMATESAKKGRLASEPGESRALNWKTVKRGAKRHRAAKEAGGRVTQK